MSGRKIPVGEALGHRRMRPGCKEEVIAFLAASSDAPAARRRWYREWCGATLTKPRPEDLARVAPAPVTGEQLSFFWGGRE